MRDRTGAVWLRGYRALSELRRRGRGGDQAKRRPNAVQQKPMHATEVRLFGRRTFVVSGPEGVRLFYDERLTTRAQALPPPVQAVLFGNGSVHGLDGGVHRQRKALFLSLLGPASAQLLATQVREAWAGTTEAWINADREIELFDEAVSVFGSAVCTWAGVPSERIGSSLPADLARIVDGFGSVGARHFAARRARRRADAWATCLIEDVRAGRLCVAEESPLGVIADWRDVDGRALDASVAGVELLNVFRPTTAVAWFVAYAALALDDWPEWRDRIGHGDGAALSAFAHEVRRFYPFAPMLAARARTDFAFSGHRVPTGRRIVLDLYGTLHDPDAWPDPERFDPARFLGPGGLSALGDAFVPQGGGDPVSGHRCPGEPATLALLGVAIERLADLRYRVVSRSAVRLSRVPPRPRVILADVALEPRAARSARGPR